jgi:hypothetical protein
VQVTISAASSGELGRKDREQKALRGEGLGSKEELMLDGERRLLRDRRKAIGSNARVFKRSWISESRVEPRLRGLEKRRIRIVKVLHMCIAG